MAGNKDQHLALGRFPCDNDFPQFPANSIRNLGVAVVLKRLSRLEPFEGVPDGVRECRFSDPLRLLQNLEFL